MYRVFDFECPDCGDIQEHLIQGEEAVHCELCTVLMTRLPASPRLDYNGFWLAGMESGDRWTKWRKEKQKRQQRSKDEHGSYGSQSSSWDKTEITVGGERLKKVQ